MEDINESVEHFNEIKQTSVNLPPSSPQVLSEKSSSNTKIILVNAIAFFGIAVFVIISFLILFPKKSKNTIAIIQAKPTPQEHSVVTLNTTYNNPFETSTQYSNPFSPSNPFANISQ